MFDRGNRQYYVAAGGIPLLMKAFQTVAITEHPYEIRICQDCTHTFSSNLCKYTRWQDHSDSISNGNDSMITWNYNVTIFFWFCENYYISTLSLFSHKSSWGKVLFAASLTFTCGLSLHASLYVAPCTSPCTSLWCAPEHRAHCASVWMCIGHSSFLFPFRLLLLFSSSSSNRSEHALEMDTYSHITSLHHHRHHHCQVRNFSHCHSDLLHACWRTRYKWNVSQ